MLSLPSMDGRSIIPFPPPYNTAQPVLTIFQVRWVEKGAVSTSDSFPIRIAVEYL